MTGTEVAVSTKTDLVIDADQGSFSGPQRTALLAMIGVEDVPDAELQVFFHLCKRSGLDPFAKQIYLIARTKRTNKNGQWVDDGHTYTIQTGIDGYRLNGKKAARREGATYSLSEPEWRGPEKTDKWDDVWLDASTPPAAARISIKVNDSTFTAVAMYHEYVQTKGNTAVPNSMWSKMPANQLRKCAEAAAWRMAFPDDFSGLVLEDAVQIIDEDGNVSSVRRAPQTQRGVAGLRDQLGIEKTPEQAIDISATHVAVEPEKQPVEAPAPVTPEKEAAQVSEPPADPPPALSQVQRKALETLFKRATLTKWTEQLEWLVNNNIVSERKITGLGDLYAPEAAKAIEDLQ